MRADLVASEQYDLSMDTFDALVECKLGSQEIEEGAAPRYFSFTNRTVQRLIETCISTCAPALGDVAD